MSIENERRCALRDCPLASVLCFGKELMHGQDMRIPFLVDTLEGNTMKRLTQIALVCVLMLALASLAAAQGTLQVPTGTPQPALRFGNFIEVGNDVLMHIIATGQFNYQTTTNFDFERKVRDRTASRNPVSTAEETG